MISHKNLYIGINRGLEEIFFKDQYADKIVEKILRENKKWGSRDRSFVAETLYDMVRWKRLIEFCMGEELKPSKIWKMMGTWFVIKGEKVHNWEEFDEIYPVKIKKKLAEANRKPEVRESVPTWLYNLGKEELGAIWDDELHALNEQAATILRCNILKTDIATLKSKLEENFILSETIEGYPEALKLTKKSNVFKTEMFQNGWFEVQDASSQMVVPFLRVEPGMRVIDACAGAGGKTLHLANAMDNKGQIYALDTYEWKLKELQRRAKRNGAFNIQTKHIDSSKVIKRLENTADRLLIDAPCSGLGVLKRNPDTKWKLNKEFLEKIKLEQQTILENYSVMLKPKGLMVYATCSILPSENEGQVAKFIANHPNFSLVEDRKVMPSTGFDGFYMALIERKE